MMLQVECRTYFSMGKKDLLDLSTRPNRDEIVEWLGSLPPHAEISWGQRGLENTLCAMWVEERGYNKASVPERKD